MALKNVTHPWHIESSHAPGTFQHSHCCSPYEESSQNCRSASMGVSGATYLCLGVAVLPGCVSYLEIWPLTVVPPGNTLDCHHEPQCPLLVSWAESSPLDTDTVVLVVHLDRVTALCFPKLGSRKMLYDCMLFLSDRNQFSYDFGSWAPGTHPI